MVLQHGAILLFFTSTRVFCFGHWLFSPLCNFIIVFIYLFVILCCCLHVLQSHQMVLFICGHIFKGLKFNSVVRLNRESCCVFGVGNEWYGEAVKSELMALIVGLAARPWFLNVVPQVLIDPSFNKTLKSSFLLFNPATIKCNSEFYSEYHLTDSLYTCHVLVWYFCLFLSEMWGS